MELKPILDRLWRRKRALAIVAGVAVLLGLMAGYRFDPPLGLTSRTAPTGAATSQILVDSPSSALANLKQNPIPLATRAGVFAQFMASTAVRDAVARKTGVPASAILAQGPFDDPAMAPSGKTGPTPPDPASVAHGKRYRLTFVAQEQLPVITVYAQAPDVETARRLADSVPAAVQEYVDRLQAEANLDERYRTQIRSLGPAQAGTVNASPTVKVIGVFFVVLVLGCGVTLLLERRRRDPAEPTADPRELDDDAEDVADAAARDAVAA